VSPDAFLGLVRARTSCRRYDPARPVSDATLADCLEAARLAPSACNRQPWRFVVVRDAETRARLCAEALLPGIPMPWLAEAPVLVALAAERDFVTHRAAPLLSGIAYHLVDCGIAGEHFVLAAQAAGLGTCWIGWIRPRLVRRILAMPRRSEVLALISVGYPAEPTPPRERLPLGEVACRERWGQPWTAADAATGNRQE